MFEDVEILNTQAIELAAKGDFQDAIACFKRALSMETKNYLLWFNLGVTYRDAGDLEKAIAAVKTAHRINEKDQEVIETLGVLSYNIGNNEEAMKYCKEGLELNRKNPHIWNTIGVIFFNKGDYEQAGNAFEQAVTLNPYYYDALFNLRDTYDELGNATGKQECSLRMKELSSGDYYAR
ncbi:MAG: tetratricopeptide repeat protein [Treponema sp.]|jgi:tetratricopeptide (TPR) repeat protein|nr:tetratricopeptide repeat protein [Treponema sp.]